MQRIALAVFLMFFGFMALMAQHPQPQVIKMGEENPTGGTYCFMGYIPQTNALWHIVGAQWRTALAHERNNPIHEGWREYTRDGVLYYHMGVGECFFVPPGTKAQVPLLKHISIETEEKNGDNQSPPITHPELWMNILIPLAVLALFFLLYWGMYEGLSWLIGFLSRDKEKAILNDEEYQHRHDPEGGGPPVFQGGIETFEEKDQFGFAQLRFQEIAASTFVGDSRPQEYRLLGDITHGVLNGVGFVEYADISPQERVFRNTPAVQVLVEHIPTSQRIFRHMLWACANGAWSGMIGSLVFTPVFDWETGAGLKMVPPVVIEPSFDEADG